MTILTSTMTDYLRSGTLPHRNWCDIYKQPFGMEAALMGTGQDSKEHLCTCGLDELRKQVGRSY